MLISRAPLRLPFGGGGTDLPEYSSRYGGFILSAAINKYVYINLNCPEIGEFIRVKYSKTEEVARPEQLQHELVREALKLTEVYDKIEISAMADVPSGTGLGSSGSFLVALLLALHTYKRDHLATYALAEEACKIEMEIVKSPVGKHDQYIAAFGGLTCLEIDTNGSVTVSPLKITKHTLDDLRSTVLLFYTGIRRSASTVLEDQNNATKRNNSSTLEGFHGIKELGLEIRKSLEAGDLDHFGQLLNRHWQHKKSTSSKVSLDIIDDLYNYGLANGAMGGKLVGAGGGGFLMFYCPNENGRKGRLREAMHQKGLTEILFDFDTEGSKILANI